MCQACHFGFYKIDETEERLLEIECYDIVTEDEDRKLGMNGLTWP